MRFRRFAGFATLQMLVVPASLPLHADDAASAFIRALEERLELTDGRCPDPFDASRSVVTRLASLTFALPPETETWMFAPCNVSAFFAASASSE